MNIKIRQLDPKYKECISQMLFAGKTNLYDGVYEFLNEDVSRREMYLSDMISLLDSYHAITDYVKSRLFDNIEKLGCSFILADWFNKNYVYDNKHGIYYNKKTMK